MTRKDLFDIIEKAEDNNKLSKAYDIFMLVMIVLSILPLALTADYNVFIYIEWIATIVFILDYILRWITADYKLEDKGKWAFVYYPISLWAIIDILSILPSFALLNPGFKVMRATRLLRLFRLLKTLRYGNDDSFKGFVFFWEGMKAAKKEMWVSIQVLVFLTFFLSIALFFVEHTAQPEKYTNLFDSIIWAFMSYLGNPGKFSPGDPITILGRFIWIIISMIKIAIFAVPAGLIANGFRAAMAKDKRDKQLEKFRDIILRSFTVKNGRNLQTLLKTLPKDENAWYNGCKFKYIANNIRVSKYLLKGIELKDVLDVCKKYPEFRVKNRASALSSEDENKTDVYMIEHFPVNTVYGCLINRKSKVTIISTSSGSELDTGNFSFYLAKWAGFNYISKDFNADSNYAESYYNNPWLEPKVDGKRLQDRLDAGEKVSKEMKSLYERKKILREKFLQDLEVLTQGEDTWAICILTQLQNKDNKIDIHVTHNTEDGQHETIHDIETYNRLLDIMTCSLREKFELETEETTRYPLLNNGKGKLRNIAYKLQEDGCKCNSLTMRVSSHLMEFDTNMRPALFLMAKAIKETIEPNHLLPSEDVIDMNRTNGYGFMPVREQNADKIKNNKLWSHNE